ncbi:type II toxin-antitoxin system VapC family toxin [Sphingomonas sp. UV9]|uniref:type II toxin-antitoxin system VapC family toxin n=1 Tax=Sphingomonas sp. UV9 TaxID=1851410 RepID=UPI000FFC9DA7|nr:type II toxin-antitoxin system VapC family toxin [Sphingomonas sp. UV9]RXD05296.1 type II toxin-antitoxin system VapC family toxin [Sphingomonas sp. UV9]
MTIFVDASAIVAIIYGEPEADDFADAIESHNDRYYCAVGAWEAAQAIAKLKTISPQQAADAVSSFAEEAGLRMVPIGEGESREAVVAAARYGKGRHPAKLNMGDCFAYACAKTNGAELLYKGNDFAQTDLA